MQNLFFKKSPVVTVVAIGIGAALFYVLGRFAAIPTPIPNTTINLQYAILALFALLYGPIAGGLIGLIGHFLIDATTYGAWWSWIITSAIVGFIIGLLTLKLEVNKDKFNFRGIGLFSLAVLVANLIGWMGIAPGLDVAIYAEPADKVFLLQGPLAFGANALTSIIVGGILAYAYAATQQGKGSLELASDK